MPLTFGQIAALAREAAHSPGKIQQSYDLLNAILSDLCQERDFAEARGQFLFNFTPGQKVVPSPQPPVSGSEWGTMIWGQDSWQQQQASGAPWGTMVWGVDGWGEGSGDVPVPVPPSGPTPIAPSSWPGAQFGSGPYQMPVDYLRLSGSSGSSGSQKSFIWWLNGVPYPVIPCDLAEFDMQVQQTGIASYVWLAATDMSAPIDDRILVETTADVVAGSTTIVNIGNVLRLLGGNVLGVGGQGIMPGTTLELVGATGPVIGTGSGSPIGSGGGVIGTGGPSQPGEGILSQPAVATIPRASLIFGYAPVIFVYPPPISSQPAMIRYQKQMPPITDPTRYPWMRNDGYLIEKLTGRLCQLNDDERQGILLGGPDVQGSPEQKLSLFLSMKDDDQSRPKRVELDRRAFGRHSRLPATKQVVVF